MKRRDFLKGLGGAGLALGLPYYVLKARGGSSMVKQQEEIPSLHKSKEEWRELLEPERYRILFQAATERAFSSPLNEEKRQGTYICAACFNPLFDSQAKFDSGTGWPSFFRALEGRIETKRDFKLILPRTEYHCARCGGHQGHVFNDGPPPTGKRYCNNGLALKFVPEDEALPDLRT